MSRSNDGSRRSGRRTQAPSIFQQALALSLVWLDASGHITLSGTGDVLSVHDRRDDTHVLTQADTAKQVDPPAAHADFAGQLCLTLTGAEWYQSNRPPSYWIWGSNGTGVDIYFAATNLQSSTPAQCMLATQNISAHTVGFAVQIDGSAGNFGWYVNNGTAYAVSRNDTNQFATGSPGWACASHLDGDPAEVIKRKQATTIFSGAGAAPAPSASDPVGTLRLGASAVTGSFRFVGRVRSALFFPRLTTTQRSATVDLFMAQDTGIAA